MKASLTKNKFYSSKNGQVITRFIAFLPSVFMMTIIFLFSANNGEESSKDSGFIVQIIWNLLDHVPFLNINHQQKMVIADNLEFVVRKAAHMTEYGILAICFLFGVFVFFKTSQNLMYRKKYIFMISWVMTILYAMTDEYHQLFVPGRSGKIMDVGIDATGALIFLAILAFSFRFKKRRGKI